MGSAELSSFMSCQTDTFVADVEIMKVFRNSVLIDICCSIFVIYLQSLTLSYAFKN